MNRVVFLSLSCLTFVLLACSTHRQADVKTHIDTGAWYSESHSVVDSAIFARIKSIDFINPRLAVIRRTSDDTTLILFESESVTMRDSDVVISGRLSTDSVAVNYNMDYSADSHSGQSVKPGLDLPRWIWIAILIVVIALSLRGIGSRR